MFFGLFSQIARTHARFMLYNCHFAQTAKNCQISAYTCPRINKKLKFDQISKFNLKLKFLEFISKSEESAFTGLVRPSRTCPASPVSPDNLANPDNPG